MLLVVDESDMSMEHWWYDFLTGENVSAGKKPCSSSVRVVSVLEEVALGQVPPPPQYTLSPS